MMIKNDLDEVLKLFDEYDHKKKKKSYKLQCNSVTWVWLDIK